MKPIRDIRQQRLQILIDEAGGQAALAERIRRDRNQVWQWTLPEDDERGRGIGPKMARYLERMMDRPSGWMDLPLEFSTPAPSLPVAITETARGYVRFPLLEGFAGMGRGDYVGDYPEIVEFVEVTREWATQKLRGIPVEAIRVITGRGDSMRGQYSDGDLVFVDARIKQFLGDSAYCYRWNGQVQIKRLQLVGRGLVRILSENPKYPPIEAPLDELEIGGRALAAWTLHEF